MKILHTLDRHAKELEHLKLATNQKGMRDKGLKYICVVVDGPESLNRESSWASSFSDEDTHKIFAALAEQTRA